MLHCLTKALVTSRETLRLRGEREVSVPALASEDAVGLFVQRSPRPCNPTFGSTRV
ncbi:MAG: hypothetical protein R2911_41230 [Caldilineaceae bacterium]